MANTKEVRGQVKEKKPWQPPNIPGMTATPTKVPLEPPVSPTLETKTAVGGPPPGPQPKLTKTEADLKLVERLQKNAPRNLVGMPAQEAHERLLNCVYDMQVLANEVGTHMRAFYVLSDMLDGQPPCSATPDLGYVIELLRTAATGVLPQLLAEEAKSIVELWNQIYATSGDAVMLCNMLAGTERDSKIQEELQGE